jgi:hypothetical protein
VWEAAIEAARAQGHLVLSCRLAESEAKLSYGALVDLVSDVGQEEFAVLPEPQRDALEVALLRRSRTPRWPTSVRSRSQS